MVWGERRGTRNEVRNEVACGWSANQTSNLVLVDMSWEGRRTRDAGTDANQPEFLHLGRELELPHIAWGGVEEERGGK